MAEYEANFELVQNETLEPSFELCSEPVTINLEVKQYADISDVVNAFVLTFSSADWKPVDVMDLSQGYVIEMGWDVHGFTNPTVTEAQALVDGIYENALFYYKKTDNIIKLYIEEPRPGRIMLMEMRTR